MISARPVMASASLKFTVEYSTAIVTSRGMRSRSWKLTMRVETASRGFVASSALNDIRLS
ncbi:hypothetical protein QF001_004437 [Paraburkholderia youngii]